MGSGEERAGSRRCLLVVAGAAALAVGAYALRSWAPAGAATPLVPLAGFALVGGFAAVAAACWVGARQARARAEELAARLERRERTVAQRLDDLAVLKAELIAVVSHEFRTPLTSLTGYARTLAARMDELPPSAVHQCVSGIDHHATRLARLVHNVLAAEGDIGVDPQAVTDLSAIVRYAAEGALQTHDNRVVMKLDLPPMLRARVDLLSAHQILGNLLDNAVKFAPGQSVVEVRGSTQDGAAVVEVANGVDRRADLDPAKLFEPFLQADSSETRRGEGLGLGLHVARRLTVAHGGRLEGRIEEARIVFRLVLPTGAAPCALEARLAGTVADAPVLGS